MNWEKWFLIEKINSELRKNDFLATKQKKSSQKNRKKQKSERNQKKLCSENIKKLRGIEETNLRNEIDWKINFPELKKMTFPIKFESDWNIDWEMTLINWIQLNTPIETRSELQSDWFPIDFQSKSGSENDSKSIPKRLRKVIFQLILWGIAIFSQNPKKSDWKIFPKSRRTFRDSDTRRPKWVWNTPVGF